MDYVEYISEDMIALPHHQWNQGRRWAVLCEREEVDNHKATAKAMSGGVYGRWWSLGVGGEGALGLGVPLASPYPFI
jgi:hypothetical protein